MAKFLFTEQMVVAFTVKELLGIFQFITAPI